MALTENMQDSAYPAISSHELADEQPKDLSEYVAAVKRRKFQILVIAGLLALVTVVLAMTLPPSYRSTATILVQEQEIPQDFVRSTVTSFADERIQVISQQVMTRAVLLSLADKYGLYANRRAYETAEEILDRMRRDIKLSTINADITDRRSGSRGSATIAFQLSYESSSPQSAQRVVNELVSLYLNENVKTRQQRAAETNTFVTEEAERLGAQISEMEAKLADFKQRNQGRLPELAQANAASLDRLDGELARIERDMSAIEDRKAYIEREIAAIKDLPPPPTNISPDKSLDPAERLKYAQAQYTSLSGVYSEEHPDLVRLRREMASLKREIGKDNVEAADSEVQTKRLQEQRAQLASMQDKYSEDHPDILKLKRSIAALEDAQKSASKAVPKKPAVTNRYTESPLLITLRSQFDGANAELKQLRALKKDYQHRMQVVERRVEQTPLVEKEYLDLIRDHENATSRYREIRAKQMQAEIAESLEKDRKAERFTLIDPPQLPERPYSPNRPMILAVGILLSLGGGVGFAALREAMDRSIKGIRDLGRSVNIPVLGQVPYIESNEDRARRTRSRRLTIFALLGVIVLLLLFVHFFVMELPIVWYQLSRRAGIGN